LLQLASGVAFTAGLFAAQTAARSTPVKVFSIEDLYERLITAERSASVVFENVLEQTGSIRVMGRIGEVSVAPDQSYHVWLRHSTNAELVGRFRIAADDAISVKSFAIGQHVTLLCLGVYRSYAQVAARSCRS
jgi:hypothetical protein